MTAAIKAVMETDEVQEQFKNAGIPVEMVYGDKNRIRVMEDAAIMESLADAFGWKNNRIFNKQANFAMKKCLSALISFGVHSNFLY
jgi:hypothetical protein